MTALMQPNGSMLCILKVRSFFLEEASSSRKATWKATTPQSEEEPWLSDNLSDLHEGGQSRRPFDVLFQVVNF
jgi:hypothetical protein